MPIPFGNMTRDSPACILYYTKKSPLCQDKRYARAVIRSDVSFFRIQFSVFSHRVSGVHSAIKRYSVSPSMKLT